MLLEPLLEELEIKYLIMAIKRTADTKNKAGEVLRMSFRSFQYRLAKLGLDDGGEEYNR